MAENQSDFWNEYRTLLCAVDPDRFPPKSSPTPILFQCGRLDMAGVKRDCELASNAAGEPKALRWYATGHPFVDLEASLDRLLWLARTPAPDPASEDPAGARQTADGTGYRQSARWVAAGV